MALYFRQALTKALEDSERPVITEFELDRLARPIIASGQFDGEKVRMVPSRWEHHQLQAMVRTLTKNKVLAPDHDFRKGVWHIVGALTAASAEEAICLVDPFAYISHLSAMQRYGLTDRSPEALHMTTPARSLWTEMRDARMREMAGLGDRPPLTRIGFEPIVRRRAVILHETRHPAPTSDIADESARIATIGHIFVDMLDQPTLCGGIQHVLDCFDRHAEQWLEEIIDAVDFVDSPIIKVRAGYILDEWLKLGSARVEKWNDSAQRGGSRKLDAKAPYGSVWSDKWMIALNV